jgi:hypothetical protein
MNLSKLAILNYMRRENTLPHTRRCPEGHVHPTREWVVDPKPEHRNKEMADRCQACGAAGKVVGGNGPMHNKNYAKRAGSIYETFAPYWRKRKCVKCGYTFATLETELDLKDRSGVPLSYCWHKEGDTICTKKTKLHRNDWKAFDEWRAATGRRK